MLSPRQLDLSASRAPKSFSHSLERPSKSRLADTKFWYLMKESGTVMVKGSSLMYGFLSQSIQRIGAPQDMVAIKAPGNYFTTPGCRTRIGRGGSRGLQLLMETGNTLYHGQGKSR